MIYTTPVGWKVCLVERIIVQVQYQALLLMIAGVSDMATLHFGTGWKSFEHFCPFQKKLWLKLQTGISLHSLLTLPMAKDYLWLTRELVLTRKHLMAKLYQEKEYILMWKVQNGLQVYFYLLITIQQFHVLYNSIFLESTRETLRIGGSKLETNSNFDGKLSCFQYFKKALTPSQIHHFMNCDLASAYKTSSCPEHFHDINGLCYYFPSIQLSFSEAELFCMSPFDEV